MLTDEKEDYLKVIYELSSDYEFVPNKSIAQALNIKPPSVSEMMTRLNQEGYIEIKPYKGVKLSQKGLDATLSLIKRHRIIECFLIASLDYKWNEVHEEAEVLEHKVSDKFIERLDKMLGYPKYCPHGALIPRDNIIDDGYETIMQLEVQTAFELKKVDDEYQLLQYLSDQNVSIGDTLILIKKDNANNVVHIQTSNQETFIISFENAMKMYYAP